MSSSTTIWPLARFSGNKGFPGGVSTLFLNALLALPLLLGASLVSAQDGVIWQSSLGENASIRSLAPTLTLPNAPDLYASARTNDPDTNVYRSLVEVDLSGLDPSWVIEGAYLNLFGNPTSTRPVNEGFNECWIERIVDPWSSSTVTWDNQPSTTTQNRVPLPRTWEETEDLLEIDVTELIQDMLDNPGSSYGLMLRLQSERVFRSRVFASPAHPDASLHPQLIVEYRIVPDTGGTTGLTASVLALGVQVGPNPCVDRLQVEADLPFAGEWTVALYDLQGRMLMRQESWSNAGPFQQQLDLRGLSVDGVLMLRLEGVEEQGLRRAAAVRRLLRTAGH